MKNFIYTIKALIILLAGQSLTFAQSENSNDDKDWHRGTIVLANGQKVNGMLNYNFFTDIVSNKTDGYIAQYSAKDAAYFEIQDDSTSNSKKYYSLTAESEKDRMTKKRFFEVLYKAGSVAILRRNEFYFDEHGTTNFSSTPGLTTYGTVTTEEVKELIYLANSKYILEYASKTKGKDEAVNDNSLFMNIEDLKKIAETADKKMSKRLRYKVTNESALKTMSMPQYDIISEYIKAQDLDVDTIVELIQVVDYISEINK